MASNQFSIMINNRFQNLGQEATGRSHSPGNLSTERPTVEQMNQAMSGGGTSGMEDTQDEPDEPAVGEHLREAVETVRRLFSASAR